MLAQFLIAILAFVFVRDYMSDGFIKNAVANVLNRLQVPARNGKPKTDQAVAVAVNPPPVLEAVTKQEAELIQETPKAVEPEPRRPPRPK